jgi:uncharacterized protein (TIGR03382 family)
MHSIARTTHTVLGLVLGLAASSVSTAAAAPTYFETTVHDTTTSVEVDLNNQTVLCSAADYGATFLKILIPDLAKLTLLDHQNTGAGAPCVASGPCEPGNLPADIIDPADPTETVQINVKAVRGDSADDVAQTCETGLTETVKVTIRGVDFFHQRFAPLGQRPYADCVTSSIEPQEPDPTTDPDPDPDTTTDPDQGKADTDDKVEEPSGGCNAAGSGSSSLAVLALGLVGFVGRRRRA